MKLKIKGKGAVSLSKRDFVASGGEGSVYARGSTAYKIYTNPKRMIPVAKIDELSVLSLPNIIRPQDVLLNTRTKPVGYTMRYVQDTYSLCQLFTKAFKKRNNVQTAQLLKLAQVLQDGVKHVHEKGILVVDLNEMNFLVSAAFDDVYFIDVDSYQTKSFQATAIMDSIRDYQAKRFDENSDWFSWAIVTFQLFMGIHPYKGKHKDVKKLEDRMKANLSVFNAEVSIPKMCPPMDTIPQAYRDWYKAVFEEGLRLAPPFGPQAVAIVTAAPRRIVSADKLQIMLIETYEDEIVDYQDPAVLTTGGAVVRKRVYATGNNTCIAVTPDDHVVAAWLHNGWLQLRDLTVFKELKLELRCEQIMAYDGRVYCKSGEQILELEFIGGMPSARPTATAMLRATQMFSGVALHNMLGGWYAGIFPKAHASYQIRLKELDGYRIVDAKYDRRVLMVVGMKKGKYDKFIFRIQPDYQGRTVRTEKDVAYTGLNFVVLENGVCAHINDEEQLELFVNNPIVQDVKIVEDPVLSHDMQLLRRGTDVLFARGRDLYKLSTRKT